MPGQRLLLPRKLILHMLCGCLRCQGVACGVRWHTAVLLGRCERVASRLSSHRGWAAIWVQYGTLLGVSSVCRRTCT